MTIPELAYALGRASLKYSDTVFDADDNSIPIVEQIDESLLSNYFFFLVI